MAALEAAIQFLNNNSLLASRLDGRVKPGHDEGRR